MPVMEDLSKALTPGKALDEVWSQVMRGEIEGAVEAVFVDASIDAVGVSLGLLLGLAAVIVLAGMAVLTFFYVNWLRDPVGRIPVVGGTLQNILDMLTYPMWALGDALVKFFGGVVVSLLFALRAIAAWAVNDAYGGTLSQVGNNASQLVDLENFVYTVQGPNINVLNGWVNAVQDRVAGDEAQTKAWQDAVGKNVNVLNGWVNAVQNRVATDEAQLKTWQAAIGDNVSALNAWVHGVVDQEVADVRQLKVGIAQVIDENAHLKQRVDDLQRQLDDPTTGLSRLSTLLPLATLLPQFIESLRKTAQDECRCLNPGGGMDWVAPAVVVALSQG